MNVTVLGLLISGSYGPALFTPSVRRSVSSFSASNCRSSRFFKSFLASPVPQSVRINMCQFRNFEDSAISINGNNAARDVDITDTAKKEHMLIDTRGQVGKIDITSSIFLGCKAERGGAVQVIAPSDHANWKQLTLTISKCTFGSCYATKSGGAMYVTAMEGPWERGTAGSNFITDCCIGNCGLRSVDSTYELAPAYYSFSFMCGAVVVQLLVHVQLFVTPWTTACQAFLSFTTS